MNPDPNNSTGSFPAVPLGPTGQHSQPQGQPQQGQQPGQFGQPQPGQPQPDQPWMQRGPGQQWPTGPNPALGGPAPKKFNTGLIVGIIAGVVVLGLLFVVGVGVLLLKANEKSSEASVTGQSGQQGAGQSVPAYAQPVMDYLNAIAAGDADKAKTVVTASSSYGQDTLLTNQVLQASSGKISNPTLGDPGREYGGLASVNASYTLDGKTVSQRYSVKKINDQWKVELYSYPRISVNTSLKTILVNGVSVPLTSSAYAFNVFPGTYVVQTPVSKYIVAQKQTVAVTDELTASSSTVALPADPTEAAKTEISKQVNAEIDRCGSKERNLTKCPLYSSEKTGKWVVKTYPTLDVTKGYDNLWNVSTAKTGSADLVGTANPYMELKDRSISLSAKANVDGDTLSVVIN